jgi:hypothetical protein
MTKSDWVYAIIAGSVLAKTVLVKDALGLIQRAVRRRIPAKQRHPRLANRKSKKTYEADISKYGFPIPI